MRILPKISAAEASDRTGVIERNRVSLGQKVIGIGVAIIAVLMLIGMIALKLFFRPSESANTNDPIHAAAENKGPGELMAPPDIQKPCPPGIDCNAPSKPNAAAASAPTESDEEAEMRKRKLMQEELLREIVLERRLSSQLTDKQRAALQDSVSEAMNTSASGDSIGMQRVTYLPTKPNTNGTSNNLNLAQAAGLKTQNASSTQNELERQLTPSQTPGSVAGLLPNRSLMVAKGQSSTCVLDVAMSSEQPGFVRCVLDFPVMSADGKAMMMERGTTIDGEYRKGVDRGVRSAFVLWTRAVTPEGVYINLDSPATDGLGRTGIPGEVDSRFWDRYKGALLFSVLQDLTQLGTGMLNAFGVTGPYGIPLPQNFGAATTNVAAEIIKKDSDVKDVLVTNQGKTIGITFARDLDFSTVYGLKLRK